MKSSFPHLFALLLAPLASSADDLGVKIQPKYPGPTAEALAGTPGSDGFEQRPPWLVRMASAGHFRPLKNFFGK
jgi:hypothetical protein